MKSKNKKQGGAYRYYKQRSSLHAKSGKKRGGQANTQIVTLDGWMAHQNVNRKLVWVCDNKGKKVCEFMVDEMLTAEQLKEYIRYCQKYCVAEANNGKKETAAV